MMALHWLANLCDDIPEIGDRRLRFRPEAGEGGAISGSCAGGDATLSMPAIARFFPMQYALLQLPRQ
jgi:hypothetical protein